MTQLNPHLATHRATPADFSLARQAVVEVHGRTPVDDAALERFLADAGCYLMLAVEDGRVIGSLNGYRLWHPNRHEPQFLLYELDVREECRGRGVGRAVVAAFTAEARKAGAFEAWVLTNKSNRAAMAAYQRCGYQRRNLDDVMLSLDL